MEEDKELEEIMKRKMRRYMELMDKKKSSEIQESQQKADIFQKVRRIFTEDGYNHLMKIASTNKALAEKMIAIFIELIYTGYITPPIDYILVERLRRKLTGEKGKIFVYKKGELKDLSESLKEED